MKFIKILLTIFLFNFYYLYAEDVENPAAEERTAWFFNTTNTTDSGEPSNLKYFKFFDRLPSEISLKVLDNIDISNLGNKRLYVGYGVVDPREEGCKTFSGSDIGQANDLTICLPWWRIEREYKKNNSILGESNSNLVGNLRKNSKPPIVFKTCKASRGGKIYDGGKVTCTTYYDKLASDSCWNNPKQYECFVNNCGKNLQEKCERLDSVIGERTTLSGALLENGAVVQSETKIGLTTMQFECPDGPIFEDEECTELETNLVFPYECSPSNTLSDGSITEPENIYCDEDRPVFDELNNVTGYKGTCSDGRDVICKVNKYENTRLNCKEPIYETQVTSTLKELEQERPYSSYEVDVISGEPDMYSQDSNCIRTNTTDDSRNRVISAKIIGNGFLDDDIYVLKHSATGTFEKVYCNMQHAGAQIGDKENFRVCLESKGFPSFNVTGSVIEKALGLAKLQSYLDCAASADNTNIGKLTECLESSGFTVGDEPSKDLTEENIRDIDICAKLINGGTATKIYDGTPISCLRNNGSYSFDQTINMLPTDIITVQQNSEMEKETGTPFAVGRNHYRSTKVVIDNVEVAPDTFVDGYPYYPRNDEYLKTWDNTTSNFSILFPFASAYELYFYNKNNKLMASKYITVSDFRTMSTVASKQLQLGKTMKLSPNINEEVKDENGVVIKLNANRLDPFVEWGGGVYGGRNSLTGEQSQQPNDDYVKENAVTKVVIKDAITGSITPIKLVYPLAYPNRVFIAKLKIYEKRKYRCYENYPPLTIVNEDAQMKHICSTNSDWIDFKNERSVDFTNVQQWMDKGLCEQNCREEQTCRNEFRNINGTDTSGYTCSERGGEDLGGDLEGNFFSSSDDCQIKCYKQNSCDTFTNNQCVLVEESPTNNLTDVTGKTVSTKRKVAARCDSRNDIEVGCAQYDTITQNGDIEYNLGNIGYETKNYSADFEDAMTNANMLEVGTQHIWSGWKGKCVSGKKWDFSYLSDPLTLMSYAFSAYQSMEWMSAQGGAVAEASTEASDSAVAAGESAEIARESYQAAVAAGTTDAVTLAVYEQAMIETSAYAAEAAKAAAEAAIEASNSFLVELNNSWTSWTESAQDSFNTAYTSVMENSAVKAVTEATEKVSASIGTAVENASTAAGEVAVNISDAVKEQLGIQVSSLNIEPDLNLGGMENLANQQAIELELTQRVQNLYSSAKEALKETTGIDWDSSVIGDNTSFINVTQGDLVKFGVKMAFEMAAPQEDDYALASKLLQGYAGIGAGKDTVAYNNCMASIGASLPNLIGWSSSSDPSAELKRPWEHALRMTPQQLASIAIVTSEEYVTSHFIMDTEGQEITLEDRNSILINVVAISSDAYLKAAQTVCMGNKVSQAASHIQSSGGGGGGGGFKLTAMGVAKMALGMVCPPCGFALTIIMDLATNVAASIDTCTNQKDAMEWDLHHLKTQKFLKQKQCKQVKSYCDQETFFGCVRTAYDHCCYDQITTRIFAEGVKEQTGKGWNKCNDLTINDLKDISFRECASNENPKIDKCFPSGKYSEFQQTLFKQASKGISFEGLSQQVINSMAIDTEK